MRKEIFDPSSSEPYPLSRNKIEVFLECPRCFYLWVRKGHARPSTPPFTLNIAVDTLIKRRFDHYRRLGQPDPLMAAAGVPGVPFAHPDQEAWRDYNRGKGGIQHVHPATNFRVIGVLDDVWDTQTNGLSVVDTKGSDDKKSDLTTSYFWTCNTRQMDVYTYVLKQCGFPVNLDTYFIWAQAVCYQREEGDDQRLLLDGAAFTMKFKLSVVQYRAKVDWIDERLMRIKECLMSDSVPKVNRKSACKYCRFRKRICR